MANYDSHSTMKKIIFGFIVGLLSILHLSCNYDCPGYPESELLWIPYDLNDTLIYTNQDDTILFVVIDKFITEPSTFKGIAMDYECMYEGYYLTTKTNLNYQLREENSNGFGGGMKMQITDSDIFGFNIWDKSSFSDSIKVVQKQDTLINHSEYKEVYILSKDTLNLNPRISYIIKTPNQGIVEFYDYHLKKKWSLLKK
jgi:hypothetical protein